MLCLKYCFYDFFFILTVLESFEQQNIDKKNLVIINESNYLTTDTMGGVTSAEIKICSTFENDKKNQNNCSPDKQNNENKYHTCNKTISIWNYNDDDLNFGPCNWPTEVKCGTRQSPINLRLSIMRSLTIGNNPLKFVNYSNLINGEFINTGYSSKYYFFY